MTVNINKLRLYHDNIRIKSNVNYTVIIQQYFSKKTEYAYKQFTILIAAFDSLDYDDLFILFGQKRSRGRFIWSIRYGNEKYFRTL